MLKRANLWSVPLFAKCKPSRSCDSSHKILKKYLHLRLYTFSMVQQLCPPDFVQAIHYWYNNNLLTTSTGKISLSIPTRHGSTFLNILIQKIKGQVHLHPLKIGVLVAMSPRQIIGPIFFHETINAQRYRRLLFEPFINW